MDKYKIKLSEKADNLNAIAIVEDPAIESNFLFFNKDTDKKIFEFSIENEEKRTIIGPAMIPDKLIYRVDKNSLNKYEYEIVFTKEEVRNISKKFLNGEKKFNFSHNNELVVEAQLTESWIVEDINNDKINFYKMKDIPVGSWIIMLKIEDDMQWEYIKSGKFNGFSVEGFFDLEEKFSNKKQIINKENDLYTELNNLLDEILFDIDNIK